MYFMTISSKRLLKSTLWTSLFHQFVHLIILHSNFSDNLSLFFKTFVCGKLWNLTTKLIVSVC